MPQAYIKFDIRFDIISNKKFLIIDIMFNDLINQKMGDFIKIIQ
jgi:hypothetical protein